MCQVPPYSHPGKTCSGIQAGKKDCGQSSLLKDKHHRLLFWQQDIQPHSTELTLGTSSSTKLRHQTPITFC